MSPNLLTRLAQVLHKSSLKNEKQTITAKTNRPETVGPGILINDRFQLDAEIGRGGMGIVYRAEDLKFNRDAAVKIINFQLANSLTRDQFSREAQITSRLNHPHIVAVYEVGTVETGGKESSPYLAMEYVPDGSLADLHGLTYARIIDLGKQICEALDYAHKQGFVHRDLKPGNVLISKSGLQTIAKLVDFGLALPRGEARLPDGSPMAGTVFYLAPEVISGQPADVPSDLYALGIMLYEMVTDHVPFSDFFDDESIINQHLNEQPAPPSQSRSDIPPALEHIILKLLAKEPKKRFVSAQEVWSALNAVPLEGNSGNNLPASTMDLRAYEKQIGQAVGLLETNRLVTILGDYPNLAVETGFRLLPMFRDGVWLVELGSIQDPKDVLPAAATALGIINSTERPLLVVMIEQLREKNILLILSHCGDLVESCAQLAGTIFQTCPEVHILVASSRPLNLPDENCVEVN